MTYIYKKKTGAIGALYHKYMSYIIRSGLIDKVICYSKNECSYYAKLFDVDDSLFAYAPLGIFPIKGSEDKDLRQRHIIFSTGRSNRDYKFLVDAAKQLDNKVVIACQGLQLEHGHNVEILQNCYGEEMYRYLHNAWCVVLPLKDLNISSGQLVILQAMQLKTPIIVTRAAGIEDYIEDGVTGLMIENNLDQLKVALSKLEDETFKDRLTSNAYEYFISHNSLEAQTKRIAEIIDSIS